MFSFRISLTLALLLVTAAAAFQINVGGDHRIMSTATTTMLNAKAHKKKKKSPKVIDDRTIRDAAEHFGKYSVQEVEEMKNS